MGEKKHLGVVGLVQHVLLVCFPGQGHVNPFLRLAKAIASKGLLVTFSSNQTTGNLMNKATGNPTGDLLPVGDGHLRFEFFDDGADLAADGLDALMHKLETAGPAALEALIRRQADAGRPVACVVNNPFLPWVVDVAMGMGIKWSLLWVQSAAVLSAYFHYSRFPELFPVTDEGWDGFEVTLPGLPPLKSEDLPSFLLPSNPYKPLTKSLLLQMEKLSTASYVLMESFVELERQAIEATAALLRPTLLPVGPLAKLAGEGDPAAFRGDMWKTTEESVEWLDGCPPASVLYVSVGSVVILTPAQVAEMAAGLAGSERRFLWVLKPALGSKETGLPDGFEEAVAGHGLVVQWCPQEAVLAHPAVAGFLTHCGWNSTVEAIAAGKPVVAFPQWGDQVTDAKFLVDEFGVGVRMKTATAAEVRRCAAELFDGERAMAMREKAARLAAAAAAAAGGASRRNLEVFVGHLLSGSDGDGHDLESVVNCGSFRDEYN